MSKGRGKVEYVNHPAHYNRGEIEAIDAIEDWGFGYGFDAGCVIKYVMRARHKGTHVEDLCKARFYLDRLILLAEKEEKV